MYGRPTYIIEHFWLSYGRADHVSVTLHDIMKRSELCTGREFIFCFFLGTINNGCPYPVRQHRYSNKTGEKEQKMWRFQHIQQVMSDLIIVTGMVIITDRLSGNTNNGVRRANRSSTFPRV